MGLGFFMPIRKEVHMNKQGRANGIYAKACDGGKDRLLFCVRKIDGKVCLTYEKDGKVVAYSTMEEVMREIITMSEAS